MHSICNVATITIAHVNDSARQQLQSNEQEQSLKTIGAKENFARLPPSAMAHYKLSHISWELKDTQMQTDFSYSTVSSTLTSIAVRTSQKS